ncbi:DUF5336 domain-containing protein [Amycolatopsis decaplanina]|uniref:Uncharacterized protein n=1 Tax=Amycolatopsis decaplanina DSM 44594 TaxID=1284240 RepID=M2XI09_9PSEU|nr:DUF5336 domain-containing protein [Amycolatopsis decaplanina]EME60621.1 hypothetical protein H074_16392 [Amycolatopsis decaplanina DSM 44594]
MSYPSGGPGYPQQGGGQQHPNPGSGAFPQQQAPSQAAPLNLALLLALAVTVLGLVQFFIGFSDEADAAREVSVFLLVSGLLAALHALPRGPKTLPFAALFSVLGAFGALDLIIGYPTVDGGEGRPEVSLPGILTVVLILGILQMLVAVAALLFEHDVIKVPAAKPQQQAPQAPYSQQFPQQGPQGPFGQQGQQGPAATQVQPFPGSGQQGQQQGEQSGPFSQPGGFQPPVTQPPGQQATTYAPQQGQFFQQPPSSSSEPGQNPGTPPGGFGQQS